MQRVQGQAEAGNTIVTTAGVSSTNVVEGSFPGAAISVFLTGTNTLASLFGDNGVTPKANPFTAAADGSWFFYAANGRYDITIVGTFGGASVNRSLADILLDDPASQTFTISVVAFSATPTFDVSLADWFQITLTGNVTGPNFANPLKGDIILVEIIQDGAGNHTWAWPVSFLRPPAVVLAANAVTSLWFGYDGANWLHLASGDAASFGSIINVLTGFRINNGAPANQALIGNGTNFVATALSLVSAQFANQGTTVTVLHGNAAGNPSFGAVVLTTDVSGTLPVANGGTGVTAAQGNGTKVQLSTGAATTA